MLNNYYIIWMTKSMFIFAKKLLAHTHFQNISCIFSCVIYQNYLISCQNNIFLFCMLHQSTRHTYTSSQLLAITVDTCCQKTDKNHSLNKNILLLFMFEFYVRSNVTQFNVNLDIGKQIFYCILFLL